MHKKYALFISLCLVFLVNCDGERDNDPIESSAGSLSLTLEEAVDKTILPAVEEFSRQANQFNIDAGDFCQGPDDSRLNTLQQGWKSLSAQWYKLAIYNFGPVNDDLIFPRITFIDSLRLRGTDYTNTVRTEIANNISADNALDEAFFDSLTFQKVGLLALESLVFETTTSEHSNDSMEIVVDYENSPRKCDLLNGLSNQIVKHVAYIRDGWKVNHKDTGNSFRTIFLNGELEDGAEPLTILITSVQGHLDYLQKRNVAAVGAQIADYSWENISATIDETEALLNGVGETSTSFFDLMTSSGFQNAVALVEENISEVRQTIQDKDPALLEIALGKLDGNFKREIPAGLQVELGINFTDGD